MRCGKTADQESLERDRRSLDLPSRHTAAAEGRSRVSTLAKRLNVIGVKSVFNRWLYFSV